MWAGFWNAIERVPDNVYLGSWFPQPSIVAQADLFIHHGGNNSFCEALYFGVPSLVMPYCWDGHDNAARAETTGTGRRMTRDGWNPAQLVDAMRTLLEDAEMRARTQADLAGDGRHAGRIEGRADDPGPAGRVAMLTDAPNENGARDGAP